MVGYVCECVGNISIVVGNGRWVPFWTTSWHNNSPFSASFQELYCLSSKKDWNIEDMGQWNDNEWNWGNFGLSSDSEAIFCNLISDLLCVLEQVHVNRTESDVFLWKPNTAEGYIVREGYGCLCEELNKENKK
ncbi:unnamed protein product [Vicia faba]|uniref:Uncharacterized protein n=1 Tax=Vicia faba TaxID=3906 RepID=A0AAV0YW14_VICFA|nr:unnamed protein product [Vicia faba]